MWHVYRIQDEIEKLKNEPVDYHEFLSMPALNCGIYRLN